MSLLIRGAATPRQGRATLAALVCAFIGACASFAKIAHLVPEEKRTAEEQKQLADPFGYGDAGSCPCPKPAAAAPK